MAFLMVLTYHKLGSNGVSTTQNIIITHLWWSMDWFRDNWHRMPWLNSFYTTIKTSKTGEKWNAGIGFSRCSSESRTISPDSGLSSALTEEVVRLFTSNTLRNSPSIDSTHPGTSRAGTYWLFGTELLIKGSPASLMAQGRKSYSWPKSLGQLDQELPWILFHKNLLRTTTETKHRLANTKGGPTREPFENPDYTDLPKHHEVSYSSPPYQQCLGFPLTSSPRHQRGKGPKQKCSENSSLKTAVQGPGTDHLELGCILYLHSSAR